MDFKTWWYDTKTTKWQIIFGTILIGIIFIGTFAFLSIYQFEEWKYSGFAKSMIGILMGTVALGVITGIIIMFQSIVATDKEKNQKIFDERLALYKQFTKQTMGIISDNILDIDEREQLKVIEKEVLLIASSDTYRKWAALYNSMLDLKKEENDYIENEEEVILNLSDKSIDFVNSCRKDLEIGVIDKATIKFSKDQSRAEIKKTKKFTVSNFENYDAWKKQRIQEDEKVTAQMISVHKLIHDYIKDEFTEINIKYRDHGAALWHIGGKKVGNLNVKGRNGVTLNLLRAEEDGYKLPNISYKTQNYRNNVRSCEYYTIYNILELDSDIKELIQKSYDMRDNKKLNILKKDHPNIKEILGLES